MTKPSVQEIDTGLAKENKEKPSSPASKPTRSERKNSKALGEEQQKKSLTQMPKKETKLSESEPANGSEITRPKKSKLPVPKPAAQEKRAEQALKRLKIKPEVLATSPSITPLLKSTIKGGLKAALDAMRFSIEDPKIKSFLKVYDRIPIGDQKRVPWEAIAIAAKINPKHLVGAIQFAIENHCRNRSRFIAVSNHPDVTEARVKYAMMANGEKDRNALDIMNGALAAPKGTTLIGKQVAVYNAGGGGKNKNDDDDDAPIGQVVYQGGDIEDRIFGTPQSNDDLNNKLAKIRDKRLEGLGVDK